MQKLVNTPQGLRGLTRATRFVGGNGVQQEQLPGSNNITILKALSVVVVFAAFIFYFSAATIMTESALASSHQVKHNKIHYQQLPVESTVTSQNVLRYVAYTFSENTNTNMKRLSMADWIRTLSHSSDNNHNIIDGLVSILRNAPFQAYRFETPGVSKETIEETPFEFVLVEDEYLERFAAIPDPTSFEEHLNCAHDDSSSPIAACVFKNLGGDATLVVPRDWTKQNQQSTTSSSYHGHLAAFIRNAPIEQITQLWSIVGRTLEKEMVLSPKTQPQQHPDIPSNKPIWFSTAGTGVPWLHFRLDTRPKYYLYEPYKIFSNNV